MLNLSILSILILLLFQSFSFGHVFESTSSLRHPLSLKAFQPGKVGNRLYMNKKISLVSIDNNGNINSTHFDNKQAALKALKLSILDYRELDPTLPKEDSIIRISYSNILISIEFLKLLIKPNQVILFNPRENEVHDLIVNMKHIVENQTAISMDSKQLPFNHIILDCSLETLYIKFWNKFITIQTSMRPIIKNIKETSFPISVHKRIYWNELDAMKDSLLLLSKKVLSVKQELSRLLQNVELNNINSHYNNHLALEFLRDKNNFEIELLVENQLHKFDWLNKELNDLLYEIDESEKLMKYQFDLDHIYTSRIEKQLAVSSLAISAGALVTGLFGMNLLSHFEQDAFAFYGVSLTIAAVMTSIYFLTMQRVFRT